MKHQDLIDFKGKNIIIFKISIFLINLDCAVGYYEDK